MKRSSSANTVGEARYDLAWQHVIKPSDSRKFFPSQDGPITGIVCDKSGLITHFLRDAAVREGESHG